MNAEPGGGNAVLTQNEYVRQALEYYRRTPGTLGHVRRHDRLVAADLYRRRIPLPIVQSALLLAAARRILRVEDAPPLGPVRSFAYFLPVIAEVLASPLPLDYVHYLRDKLAKYARQT
jgi:hypothetical protein